MAYTESRQHTLRRNIRMAILITIIGLLLNGVSAIFLKGELHVLMSKADAMPSFMRDWFTYTSKGLNATNSQYPFMRYGFDWLAFAHLFIAIAFIGPLQDPVKNEWIVRWGMIVSAISVVMAFGWERVRAIPLWWSCIDALVAVAAFVILWLCNRWIQQLKQAGFA